MKVKNSYFQSLSPHLQLHITSDLHVNTVKSQREREEKGGDFHMVPKKLE